MGWMANSETIAARFARCVDVFRDPVATEAQEAEFRALVELLDDVSVTLTGSAGRIEVNGVPCEAAEMIGLVRQLQVHGVSAIELGRRPPPDRLLKLIEALADQPRGGEIAARLREFGTDPIRVTLASPGASARHGFGAPEPVLPSPDAAAAPPSQLGTRGILRGDALGDIASVPLKNVPLVTHDPLPPPARVALPGQSEERSGASRAGGAADSGADDSLAELRRDPSAPNVDDVLAALVRRVELDVKSHRIEHVLGIVAEIARLEQRLPDGSSVRRHYAIAMRRICTRSVLEALVQLLAVPKHRAEALFALQRAGADGMEVMLDMLVAAPTVSERRMVFDALTQMTQGTEQLVHMLDHPEWFVVRNVAELVGELGMEEAVPALSRQLAHADDRVRKAAALALAKIGTRSAAEPLRRALRDRSPEVRIQVALGIGGRKASALAMPLVVALDEEKDEAVGRELILALGRVATPDAVQALIKVAQPAGRFFGRKPAAVRVAAVEALRLAGTPAAVGTLEGLADDRDKEVRAAVRTALAELTQKPRD